MAGQTTEVREIPLRPEAKLTGFLTPPPENPFPLSLLPVQAAFPMPAPVEDPFYHEEAVTDGEGAFTFAGLEGGTYELRLNSSCGARLLRFSLAPASSLSLPALSVACGGRLRVCVSPHLQGVWDVLVFAENDRQTVLTPVAQGRVGAGESWVSSPLPEGSYSVLLHNPEGEAISVDEVWLEEEGASVNFGLEGFAVRGTISYGDKPWKGRFKFVKGEKGPLEVHVMTDEEGRFATYLPQKGRWSASPLSKSCRMEDVLSFEAVPGRTLSIRFPATRLSGYVHGEGVGSGTAFVYVLGKGFPASGSFRVQQDGFFQVEGLPEGEYWVQAVSDRGIAPVLAVPLSDDEPVSRNILLMPFSFLELELTDGEQPVAGALVHFRPFAEGLPAQLVPPMPVNSDAHGVARLPVPPQAGAVAGLVLAPPLAVHSFLARAPFPSTLRITMDRSGGTLLIPEKPVLGGDEKPKSYMLPVINDYVIDVFQELTSWQETYGTLPGLEGAVLLMAPPGQHRLCFVPAERLLETLTAFPPPHDLSCTSGKLVPNGILRLKAPKSRN